MDKLFDLKFVIGLFFIIVGVLLMIYGFGTATSVNQLCGGLFSLFAILMLLPFNKQKKT